MICEECGRHFDGRWAKICGGKCYGRRAARRKAKQKPDKELALIPIGSRLWAAKDGEIWIEPKNNGSWRKAKAKPRFRGRDVVRRMEIRTNGCHYDFGRLILLAWKGHPPTDAHSVDHIDRDPTNNRLQNLRWATPAQQQANKVPRPSKFLPGVFNVNPKDGTAWARISINNKPVVLGRFPSEEDAHRAYIKAHLERFGEFSYWHGKA